jgi:folate-binding Fe-S cluster repair protein YgfZ
VFIRFLQNVTTNDVKSFLADPERIAQSSAALDPKGRIISDLRIYKPVIVKERAPAIARDQIWLMVATSALTPLQSHFSRYAYKKDLELNDISDYFDCWAYFVN